MTDDKPSRPRREYRSTATPVARVLITAAVARHLRAVKAEGDALAARNDVLREQYRAGVEPRDLVALLTAAGEPLSLTHVGRIVEGARDA